MKKILGCEYQILELDIEDEGLQKKINSIARSGYKLVSVTPILIRKEEGIGKAKRYDKVLSAQYIFERLAEEI